MYLTRLLLNPANRDAWRDLDSPYELHRTLERTLEDCAGDDRTLFRVESWRPGMRGVPVLVQTSTSRPDWSGLPNSGYCLRVDGPKPFDPVLEHGQRLAFRLVANPTKKQGNKRIALDDEAAYHDWLARKAKQSGFRVLQVAAVPFWINEEHLSRSPEGGYKKHNIPHFGVRFDGVLQVTDTDQLRAAVRNGIGPAKSFGFGLLSLAPVR